MNFKKSQNHRALGQSVELLVDLLEGPGQVVCLDLGANKWFCIARIVVTNQTLQILVSPSDAQHSPAAVQDPKLSHCQRHRLVKT